MLVAASFECIERLSEHRPSAEHPQRRGHPIAAALRPRWVRQGSAKPTEGMALTRTPGSNTPSVGWPRHTPTYRHTK